MQETNPTLEHLAVDATRARARLVEATFAKPYVLWWANELRAAAGVSGTIGSIATFQLIDAGVFELDGNLRVGLPLVWRRYAAQCNPVYRELAVGLKRVA